MDPKFVSLLIQQLLNTTRCPKCGSGLHPFNVKIESVSENQCLFKMHCSQCNAVIAADAHVSDHKRPPIGAVLQTSSAQSPLQKKVISPSVRKKESVQIEHILAMQKALADFSGSFQNLISNP